MRFKRAFVRCQVTIPESDFVKLAGLDFELIKKFEGYVYRFLLANHLVQGLWSLMRLRSPINSLEGEAIQEEALSW